MPEPSPLQRLRDRKVVQWSVAYLAAAWMSLEAISFVGDTFGWPAGYKRILIVAAGFGLLAAVVVAWYHGERGRQKASAAELLIIALLFSVAAGVIALLSPQDRIMEAGPPLTWTEDDGRPLMAVLPLDNISPNPEDAFFADGMHEQLISTLSDVRGLSVRGRTSVMKYKDEPKPLPEVAQEIGVRYVLVGSARMSGRQVVVTVQLRDAMIDELVWSDEYDREFSVENVVQLQRQIAASVADAVDAQLTPEDERRLAVSPTDNTEAFALYLRAGTHYRQQRSEQGLLRATQLFEEAVALDDSFALAYAGLADVYALLPFYSRLVSPQEARSRATDAVLQALELDRQSSEAHASLGFIRYNYDWDVEAAEMAYRRAIELDPDYPPAQHWYGGFLTRTGRYTEGIAGLRRALRLDPLSEPINRNLADALQAAGRDDEAEAQYRLTRSLYPESTRTGQALAWLLFRRGKYEEVLSLSTGTARIAAYMALGRDEEARELADSYAERRPITRAGIAVALGDHDQAFEFLEQAYEDREPQLASVGRGGALRTLRSDPRLYDLVSRMGLEGLLDDGR